MLWVVLGVIAVVACASRLWPGEEWGNSDSDSSDWFGGWFGDWGLSDGDCSSDGDCDQGD